MLSGARLGNDAPLAHAPGQQHLADGVVYLVCAGVVQVLALQVDAAAVLPGEALGQVEGRGASHVVAQQGVEFLLEVCVVQHPEVGLPQLLHAAVQDFGDVGSAKLSVIAFVVYSISFHND